MRNTNKVKRNGTKLLFSILIAFLLLIGVFGNQLDSTAFAVSQSKDSSNLIISGSYTVEEIRDKVSSGEQLYRNFRVYSDTHGVRTHQVPVNKEEADYLLFEAENYLTKQSQGDSQTFRNSPAPTWPATIILGETRADEDSIVVVLMGDAFTADQYIDDNGDEGIALTNARAVMNTMLNTYPFNQYVKGT